MLMLGEAGAGKTHLLCDVARRVVESGGPAILLLGGQISAGEPWSWISGLLDLDCTRDEFLGALDAAAEASGHRALLVIDALNESDDKALWERHLAAIARAVSRFPRIAFTVSVRSSYEDLIVPPGLVPGRMLSIRHRGFAGREYEAARAFFDHYRLVRPRVPLLLPEFRNPLFLALFCKGIASRPDRRVPSGLEGITAIFGHFVEDVNGRLSRPTVLDFDARSRPIERAIVALAREMAETGSRSVPRDRARELVREILSREDFERSLFRHLLSEGLLIENRAWSEAGRREVIQFGYERFGDHAVAKYLLDTHLDPDDPVASFAPLVPLGRYVASETSAWSERGLLEAFSIQVPERTGLELAEVAPHAERFEPVRAAFVESLIWRRPGSIGKRALGLVEEGLSADNEARCQLLDVLIRIGTSPDHPLAADYLHKILLAEDMPRRDSWWSAFLHGQWGENGAMTTLIDWAWSAIEGEQIDPGSRHRAGILLGWFLACPNRFVRDRATKALVGLFDRHLGALVRLLETFRPVDDPYIQERLYAVAYGCALRAPDDELLSALGEAVFEMVFAAGAPPPNILLRDYARGVVELALAKGWAHPEHHLASPPYCSEWVPRAPTEEELRARAGGLGEGDFGIGGSIIVSSIMGHGDFGLYVIGTNSRGLPWLSVPLTEPITRSLKYRLAAFESSLSGEQAALWAEYRSLKNDVEIYESLSESVRRSRQYEHEGGRPDDDAETVVDAEADPIDGSGEDADENGRDEGAGGDHGGVDFGSGLLDSLGLGRLFGGDRFERYASGELERDVATIERRFGDLLSPEQRIEYEAVGKYAGRRHELDQHDRFDLDLVQRWVANRVFDLGWDRELHGRFDLQDAHRHNPGRDAHKPERIGKKYQWIAYYECLARIADNFHFSDPDGDGITRYEGPWQLSHVRNIDPSWLRAVQSREEGSSKAQSWFSEPALDWETIADDRAWLHTAADLPGVPGLIETPDGIGGSWLTLVAEFAFRQESFSRDSAREYPYREIWYTLKSYIARSGDVAELLAWAKDRDLTDVRLPSTPGTHSIFYGEIFRTRAFSSIETPYQGFDGWTKEAMSGCPVELYPTAVSYTWEGNDYDCSVDDTLRARLPSRILYEATGLSSRGEEGCYFDPGATLVARDTGVDLAEPDALIIRRDSLERALAEGGYSIIWILTGEKHVMTDDRLDDESYAGRLLFSGAFSIRDGKVRGSVALTYQNRKDSRSLGLVEY